MGFANYNPEWADQIESMLENLCLLLSDCMYFSESSKDIIILETKIFEFAQEYLPQLEPDLDELFDYIHRTYLDDEEFNDADLEEHMLRIRNHLHRLDDYANIYLRYSDELTKYSHPVSSAADLYFGRSKDVQEQLFEIMEQNETANYKDSDDYVRLTPKEKKEIAEAKKAEKTQKLISYLHNCSQPDCIQNIRRMLPKTTTQIIELAKKNQKVVVYNNALWEISQLNSQISLEQKANFLSEIHDTFLVDRRHSIHEVYRQLFDKNRELFKRLYVSSPYDFFGVLKALYPNDFVYSRPNIGLPGEVFSKPIETIQNYLVNRYKTMIPSLQEYIDSLGYDLRCNLKLIKAMKRIYLSDQQTIIPAHRVELSEEDKTYLIQLILNELQENQEDSEAIAIRDLKCVTKLPTCGIPWTEWLLYSFLDKANWSGKDNDSMIYVHTTSPTLVRAIPLVSLDSEISKETRLLIADEHKGAETNKITLSADDLSHLDELIEDEIEYDWDLDQFDFDE